jgi:SPP1 family predicted phage head-tail adaptor
MKHCIQVQTPKILSQKRLADGGVVDTYDDFKEVWAEFLPIRGSERWTSDNQEGNQFLRFRIWFDEEILVDSRATYNGKAYNIKSAMNERGRDEYMILEITLAENKDPAVG